MNNKLFFSAESFHGSATSFGFCNDHIVYAWSSKKARDEYVKNCDNISAVAIRKNEISEHVDKPVPFTSQYFAVVESLEPDKSYIDGFVGEVMVCDDFGSSRSGQKVIKSVW